MSELVFPSAPTAGQIFPDPAVAGIPQWQWTGGRWNLLASTGGGANVIISATPPLNPEAGFLWWDQVGAQLYIWTGAQWVVVVNQPGGSGGGVTVSPTAPSGSAEGALWWDSVNGVLLVRFSDTWVQANCGGGGGDFITREEFEKIEQTAQGGVGRNLLHNGLFNIQQRGQGPWSSRNVTADRWIQSPQTDSQTTQIVTLTDSDRAQIGQLAAHFALQSQFTGTNTSNSRAQISQIIESGTRVSGAAVTVSFWARALAGTPRIGVAIQDRYGPHGTVNIADTDPLTSNWVRYEQTGSMIVTGEYELDLYLSLSPLNVAYAPGSNIGVQSGTVQFWGIQVETGEHATALDKPEFSDELARCERYFQTGYFRIQGWSGAVGAGTGYFQGFRTTMRMVPTIATTGVNLVNLNTQVFGPIGTTGFYSRALATAVGATDLLFNWTADAEY